MNKTPIVKITLHTNFKNSWDSFYRNVESDVSVCYEFINKYFSIFSNSITIQARVTNPKKKGWKKVFVAGSVIKISGKETTLVSHSRLRNYLENALLPSTLYVKVSENKV
jgi:hypothetical protein